MITTQHNNNLRSGAYLGEISLNPNTVTSQTFGKLFELPVVGAVYAQPLVVSDVIISDRRRNVVYIATMHNRVYAFDADTLQAPLWERHLHGPIQLPDPDIGQFRDYHDIEWEVGIVSTPVIDVKRRAIYLVSTSRVQGNIVHQVWMIDITTGDNLKPPKTIATVPGQASFNSSKQSQRSALLLSMDKVYVAFASYGDRTPYNGWVFSFDADTLAELASYNTTVSGSQGGIWQSGQGPAADSEGSIFLITGNGDFNIGKQQFGDCVLKLAPNLARLDFFSPHNNQDLNSNDLDLGSGGILMIPNTNLIVGGGKSARLYVMDRGALGGFHPTDQVVDYFDVNTDIFFTHHIHGSPVFWNGRFGPRIYVWPENDQCKAFQLKPNGKFAHNPVAKSTVTDPTGFTGGSIGMPGGILSISAADGKGGIVWANHPWSADLNQQIGDGVLRAFDALDLAQIWHSRMNRARDDFGNCAKFCPPTISDGKVYMATMGGLSHKVVLSDTASAEPALINRNDQDLVLAWGGTDDPSSLNVIFSTDGMNWGNKFTLPSQKTPGNAVALTFDPLEQPNGRTFIAWTGTDQQLNLLTTADPTLQNWGGPPPLGETSEHAPAILSANGRLVLAWTGTDDHLNVKSTTDWGATWQYRQTLNETSPTEPALAAWNGFLILMWMGGDGRINFLQSTDNGQTWVNKVTLGETSSHHPAMAIGADYIPYLCWISSTQSNEINVMHSETGDTNGFTVSPNYKRTFHETSINAPSLCYFKNKMFIAWTGTDDDQHLNVGRVSRGHVAVYGILK